MGHIVGKKQEACIIEENVKDPIGSYQLINSVLFALNYSTLIYVPESIAYYVRTIPIMSFILCVNLWSMKHNDNNSQRELLSLSDGVRNSYIMFITWYILFQICLNEEIYRGWQRVEHHTATTVDLCRFPMKLFDGDGQLYNFQGEKTNSTR